MKTLSLKKLSENRTTRVVSPGWVAQEGGSTCTNGGYIVQYHCTMTNSSYQVTLSKILSFIGKSEPSL
jgi:hypothetical protein